MSEAPISRFPVATLGDMPPDIREMVEAVQEKSGFVPNVFLALAHRPDEFRAFFAAHDALMDKADLSTRERLIIDFALELVDDSATVTDDRIQVLRDGGLTDDEIWDIGAIVAFFAMSNRLANFAAIRPNDEFYAMAR